MKRWLAPATLVGVILAVTAFSRYRPEAPVHETSVRIRVDPIVDVLFQGELMPPSSSEPDVSWTNFLVSSELCEKVADEILHTRLESARKRGASEIPSQINTSPTTTVRPDRIFWNEKIRTLRLVWRTTDSPGLVSEIARVYPTLFARAVQSRARNHYEEIHNYIGKSLAVYSSREKSLTQCVWALRGCVNALTGGKPSFSLSKKLLAEAVQAEASGSEQTFEDPDPSWLISAPLWALPDRPSPLSEYRQEVQKLEEMHSRLESLETTEKRLRKALEEHIRQKKKSMPFLEQLSRLESDLSRFQENLLRIETEVLELERKVQAQLKMNPLIQTLDGVAGKVTKTNS